MRVWQALATILAFQEKVQMDELPGRLPVFAKKARLALRAIGTTKEEMESEFPDECLYEGLYLIKHNPKEFTRRARLAMAQTIGNN